MSFNFVPINSKIANQVRTEQGKYVAVHNKVDGKFLCVVTERYKEIAERIKSFNVRSDDIWIVTYPKSGTTWSQEMLWLISNNLDFKTAREISLEERSQFIEFSAFREHFPDTITPVDNMKSPRNIKTHLPASMLPDEIWEKKPKIVYVARNPKDVIVSFYHHFRMLEGYYGTFEEFADTIMEDKLYWSPYWNHLLDFWKLRNQKMFCSLRMKK
ncbi:sulfotransferase 1 family member D1-like [Ctenocephalides felis]|uniref:sulfotransferase 1 family member D1-like n=1 Tax=Ctenocephalides felis TaxID=7515 RepID=UPI000E6E203A|nr:sulfotransferase 1 family member D1-like [Ctenocephalides felis]